MWRFIVILTCKVVNKLSKLTGHAGSVIGGRIARKLDKNILKRPLNSLVFLSAFFLRHFHPMPLILLFVILNYLTYRASTSFRHSKIVFLYDIKSFAEFRLSSFARRLIRLG